MKNDRAKDPITRRHFAKTIAAAAVAAPFILQRFSIGASKSPAKPNLAWIGLGGQGLGNLSNFIGDANIVGLCDVDLGSPGRAKIHIDRQPFEFREGAAKLYRGAAVYQDFRKMLLEMGDKIDAVGVSTHDRNHFPAAYMAMEMGKHVFVQKPLAHSLWEVRTLQKKAAEKGVITQMGNQGHAFEGMRLIKEWYLAGLIGEVREVHAWTNRPSEGYGFENIHRDTFPPVGPVPKELDWDLWLGPCDLEVGYSPELHPETWRAWWDFGCGGLGDIGCHTIDAPFWSLDLGAPTRVEADVEEVDPLTTPNGSIVTYYFPARGGQPPVILKWYEGPKRPMKFDIMGDVEMPRDGMIMIGSKGAIFHAGMRPNSPQLLPDSMWQDYRKNPAKRVPRFLPRIKSIFDDWMNGVKTGQRTCSNFDYSGPLAQVILLGTLAIRTGKPVEWDGVAQCVTNDNTEAARLVKVPSRAGWRIEDLTAQTAGRFIKA